MNDAQFLALLAAVMACIPGRPDTTIDQDIALAQEYLRSARRGRGAGAAYGTGDPTVSQTETPSAAEYTARVVQLRSELRDAVQTLSNARRAEVWEIVNKMLHLERLDAGR
jgi:hypothetical protein